MGAAASEEHGYERLLDGFGGLSAHWPFGAKKQGFMVQMIVESPQAQPLMEGKDLDDCDSESVDYTVEEAMALWSDNMPLLGLWLVVYVMTLAVESLVMPFPWAAAVVLCGASLAALHLCACQDPSALHQAVMTTFALSAFSSILATVTAGFTSYIGFMTHSLCGQLDGGRQEICTQFVILDVAYALWFVLQAGLSSVLARRTAAVLQLLDSSPAEDVEKV